MPRTRRSTGGLFLLAIAGLTGCETKPPNASKNTAAARHEHNHAHHHHAPHGGTLIELGDHFAHLELVLDEKTGSLTAYVLDGEAEKGIRIAQPGLELTLHSWDSGNLTNSDSATMTVTLPAVANPLTGEKPGDTSEFSGRIVPTSSSPATSPSAITRFEATLSRITVRGREFAEVRFSFPQGSD
jgi:hypothetical protein